MKITKLNNRTKQYKIQIIIKRIIHYNFKLYNI